MSKSRSFWVKVGTGLAAIGLGLGLFFSGNLPVDQAVQLILRGIGQIEQAEDAPGGLLQAPEPVPIPSPEPSGERASLEWKKFEYVVESDGWITTKDQGGILHLPVVDSRGNRLVIVGGL